MKEMYILLGTAVIISIIGMIMIWKWIILPLFKNKKPSMG